MRILIIKISSMGDIIHTLPAITDASRAIPNITFDWVIEETFSEIPIWHPFVHRVIPIKFRFWKNQWHQIHAWKKYFECIKQLNAYKYDAIIDAQGLLKTSLLIVHKIDRGIKHGMNFFSAKESISCWFYHNCYHISKNQHAIERIRQLFSCSLQYTLPSNLGQYNIDHNFYPKIKSNHSSPYLIFFHSTTQSQKHWPELYWHILTRYAIKLGYSVKIPFWTIHEELRVKRLKDHFDRVIILPKLTLHQIAIQIIQSKATISVDTGLSHLSAALHCPNITLYGPTDPQLIGIYGHNQIMLRSSTKQMKDLHPDYVWKIFKKKIL